MKMAVTVIVSIVLGIIITLATGAINTTPKLVGATWYGWPAAWYTVPVVPNPVWNLNYVNLLIDIIVWFVIVLVILSIINFATKKKK